MKENILVRLLVQILTNTSEHLMGYILWNKKKVSTLLSHLGYCINIFHVLSSEEERKGNDPTWVYLDSIVKETLSKRYG